MWTNPLMIAVLLLVAFFLFDFMKRRYWQNRGVAVFSGSLPLIGHVLPLVNVGEYNWIFVKKNYQTLKKNKMMGLYSFLSPVLMISDPEMIRNICVKHFDHFVDRRTMDFVGAKGEIMDQLLINAKGNHWRALRAVTSPTFSSGKLRNMFHVVDDKSKRMLAVCQEKMKSDSYINMRDIFAKYSLDVIGNCAFGVETNLLGGENTEFLKAAIGSVQLNAPLVMKLLLASKSPFIAKILGVDTYDRNQKYLYNLALQAIASREDNEKGTNFLDMMIQNKKLGKKFEETGEEIITDNSIIGGAMLFILAGFHTITAALSFLTLNLSKYPECQDNLRKELQDRVANTPNGKLTFEDIMDCKYLDAVVAETLRLHPLGHTIERKCTKDYQIPGTKVVVTKGMMVMIPIYSTQRDEEYFPDPEAFKPERFFPENKKSIPAGVYMPFGAGPRMCIAERFSNMQVKIAAADLVLNFDISLAENCKELTLDRRPGLLTPMKECMNIVLKKRDPVTDLKVPQEMNSS